MILSTDAHLDKAPLWYKTPLAQSIALGFVFLLVFTAYGTVQFYASSTYGPELAANAVSSIYVSFTICCFFAPSVVNKWGCRFTMFIGVLGYAVLLICSLIFFVKNDRNNRDENDDKRSLDYVVIIGGWFLGCGAALLWTGQGRLILEYARVAEIQNSYENASVENDQKQNNSDNNFEANQVNAGTINGIFWAVFQCSALIGGMITFLYYNQKPTGSIPLYILFLILVFIGAFSTQLLLPPSMLVHHQPSESSNPQPSNGDKIIGSSDSFSKEQSRLLQQQQECEVLEEVRYDIKVENISHESWIKEAKETMRLFLTKKMLILSLIFYYTGFCRPYQQATFGNRFFNERTIGLEMMVYNFSSIIGSVYCGRLLDSHKNHNTSQIQLESSAWFLRATKSPRRSAIFCLLLFVIIAAVGDIFAFLQEYIYVQNYNNDDAIKLEALDIGDLKVIGPTIAFACWGFSDAMIQVYCYWWMGISYHNEDDQARAVGFYKCVQSLGESIGFFLIPLNRMSAIMQLLASFGVFTVGTILAFFELPPKETNTH